MIAVADAFSILENAILPLNETTVSLWEARNGVLAQTVYAPIDMPPFRQSNMDGFALSLHDSLQYKIIGEVKAGDSEQISLAPGEAVKIFTGAAVPDSAQAVMQIEKVTINEIGLLLHETILPETNIRPKSQQIAKGSIALEKGAFLNAAAIGFLAGLGFSEVAIVKKPGVAIVTTGNELVQPGAALSFGKIYDSNSLMLQAALCESGFEPVSHFYAEDDFEATKSILSKAIDAHDVVLVSGGISVGDHDYVKTALEDLGIETLFYKVNQKPGKPLFAGKSGSKIIFALPGNPAASLTCCYVYVLPALRKLSGFETKFGTSDQKMLAHDYTVSNVRSQFLKAKTNGDVVEILPHQDSSMLDSFALANALVYVPEGNYQLRKGDAVSVYPIQKT